MPMSLPLTAYALQISWLVVALYFIGTLAAVYHWANGLWTAAITWGLTISTQSMRRWGYVCVGIFVALTLFFCTAIVAALMFDLENGMTPEQTKVFLLIVEDPGVPIGIPGK